MTHPLTNEMCEKIQLHIFNQTDADCMRAAYDLAIEHFFIWVVEDENIRIDAQGFHFQDYDSKSSSSFLLLPLQRLAVMCLCSNGRDLVRHQLLSYVISLPSIRAFPQFSWKSSLECDLESSLGHVIPVPFEVHLCAHVCSMGVRGHLNSHRTNCFWHDA